MDYREAIAAFLAKRGPPQAAQPGIPAIGYSPASPTGFEPLSYSSASNAPGIFNEQTVLDNRRRLRAQHPDIADWQLGLAPPPPPPDRDELGGGPNSTETRRPQTIEELRNRPGLRTA
jgi:hypothetical protein